MFCERRHFVAAAAPGLLLILLFGAGCRGAGSEGPEAPPQPVSTSSGTGSSPDSAHNVPKIVVLGDSLTAGLGLLETQSFPQLLQQKLDKEGARFQIVNAGISGDTSAGGLRRVDWALDGDVRVLILALGANDGLRGLPVAEMKQNLAKIIETARARNIAVLLAGMEAPPNFGPEYVAAFRKAYSDLARQYQLAFVPFLLDKVAGEPALNQGDGIHPNPAGAAIVADTVWRALKPLLAGMPAA
jgi:acyl-CoA thioesterase I